MNHLRIFKRLGFVIVMTLAALSTAACDPDAACGSLRLGQSVEGLPLDGWPESSEGAAGGDTVEIGPPIYSQCRYVQPTSAKWAECAPARDPEISYSVLGGPYSYVIGDDSWKTCTIVIRDGKIVAAWNGRGG